MSQVNRETLKSYFNTGDFPTEAQFTDFIDSVLNFVNDGTPSETLEEIIQRPSTQPAIVTGTPNILTIDLNDRKQGLFEPRKSVEILGIDIDFNYAIDNDSNGDLISSPLTLTGTRIITFESKVVSSPTPSTISTWDDSTQKLTITAGTDDLVELNFLRYKSSNKWSLMVGEVVS